MKNIIKICTASVLFLLCTLLLFPAAAEDTLPLIPISTSPVVSIELQSPPDKTTYFVGEEIDVTGAVIRLTHDDGFVETYAVNSDWCTETDSLTAGSFDVYIDYPNRQGYTGLNPHFTVKFVTPTVSEITIESLPKKTEYYTGDSFESRGISVIARYTNGETWDVSNELKFSGFDSKTPGPKTVTVSYTAAGKTATATFQVNVTQLGIVSARVSKSPDTIDYYEGQELDLTGLEVTLSYNDDSELTVKSLSEFTYEGYDKDLIGIQNVTVYCKGARVGLSIKVEKSPVHRHTSGELQLVQSSSCTEDGFGYAYCLYCKEIAQTVTYPATGHTYGEWTVSLVPTATSYGQRRRECTVCGSVDTEPLDLLRDSLSAGTATASVQSGSTFPMGCVLSCAVLEEGSDGLYSEILSSAFGGFPADSYPVSVLHLGFTVFGEAADIPAGARFSLTLPASSYEETVLCSLETSQIFISDGAAVIIPSGDIPSSGLYICVLEIIPKETAAPETEELTDLPDDTADIPGETTENPYSEAGKALGGLLIKICLIIAGVAVLAFAVTIIVKKSFYK